MIVLFDLDGVIVDTETQYTLHWNVLGEKYLGQKNFGITIKGQTLVQILDQYVDDPALGEFLEKEVDRIEDEMNYTNNRQNIQYEKIKCKLEQLAINQNKNISLKAIQCLNILLRNI